ncbi:MAG: DUF882 domain-containing protein [Pseudomonadota bacterium]
MSSENDLPGDEKNSPVSIELEKLRSERDKAIAARDALIREVLPKAELLSRSKSHGPLVVLIVLLLGMFLMVGVFFAQTARMRKELVTDPGYSKSSFVSAPVYRATRISIIPVSAVSMVGKAALSSDSTRVAVAGLQGGIALYDLRSDRYQNFFEYAHKGAVTDVAFTNDGNNLVSAGKDGALCVWGLASARVAKLLLKQGPPIRSIAVAGKWVALARDDATVGLFPIEGGPGEKMKGHTDWVRAVAFSANGKVLASGGKDNQIMIWDPTSAKLVRKLGEHNSWVNALAITPDGRYLASTGLDNVINIWDIKEGVLLHSLRGHLRHVQTLEFDSKGKFLVSGALDRQALIWDVGRGTLHSSLIGHLWQVSSAHFDRNGQFVLTSSTDGTLRIWPQPLQEPSVTKKLPLPSSNEVTFRHNTTGERLRISLIDGQGQVLKNARHTLAKFLRSGPDEETKLPALKLVSLLDKVSSHFGRERELVVISGFRSPEYNVMRTKQSSQVAKESLHTAGEAIDFRVQGVAITSLHKFIKSLRAGGVGFYPDSQFVHMDVGEVRHWGGD